MILLKSKCLVVSNGDLAFRLAAFIRNLFQFPNSSLCLDQFGLSQLQLKPGPGFLL